MQNKIVKCPDCNSTNLTFYYHEHINCGAEDNVVFKQNAKGEWIPKFPKLKHEDLTYNEIMDCLDCSSEFEINNCSYKDENGDYQNECFPKNSKSDES